MFQFFCGSPNCPVFVKNFFIMCVHSFFTLMCVCVCVCAYICTYIVPAISTKLERVLKIIERNTCLRFPKYRSTGDHHQSHYIYVISTVVRLVLYTPCTSYHVLPVLNKLPCICSVLIENFVRFRNRADGLQTICPVLEPDNDYCHATLNPKS